MKKFLSSLLALTMILSLVIVPAQAADTEITVPESVSVTKGSTQAVTATAPTSTSFSELKDKGSYTAGTPTWRWSENSSHFDIKSGGNTATVTIEGKSKTTSAENLTCTYEVVYTKAQGNITEGAPDTITVTRSDTVKVTVTDPQGDFANDISIKVQGNEYKSGLKYIGETLTANDIVVALKDTASDKYNSDFNATKTVNANSATINATATLKDNTSVSYDTTIPVEYATGAVSITADGENTSPDTAVVVVSKQKVALVASYVGNSSATCQWSGNGGFGSDTSKSTTWTAPESSSSSGDEYTLTCTFTDGNVEKSGTVKFKVVNDHYKAMPDKGVDTFTLTPRKKSA